MFFILPIQLLAILALLIVFVPMIPGALVPLLLIAFCGYVVYDNARYRRKKKAQSEKAIATRPEFDAEPIGEAVNMRLSSVQATEKALRVIEVRDLMAQLEHDMPALALVTQTEMDRDTGVQTVTISGGRTDSDVARTCVVRFGKDGQQLGGPSCRGSAR